jgi:hypothetical protein
MSDSTFQVPESTLYRKVYDELIAVQIESGEFYYFTPDSETFFEYFRDPRTLEQYFAAARLGPEAETERTQVQNFCGFLVENGLLVTRPEPALLDEVQVEYARPQFLRRGEQKLDEVAFLHV